MGEPAGSDAEASRFDPLFARSTAHVALRAATLTREREATAERYADLMARTPAERKPLVHADRAYQTWCLGEQLIDQCHRELYADRSAAEEMASLALTVADELDPAWYGSGLINDLKARAWAALGEARRAGADLRGAEEAFTEAESRLGEGSGDALEEAQVLELQAALRRDQRRIPEALRRLDEAVEIYRQYGDFHLVGRAFVQKGKALAASADPAEAIHWLQKGIALLDPLRERRLELSARHSLMLQLFESGRHEEAWFLLKASRPEFLAHGGVLLALRLRWLEGKIQHALGRATEAEAVLLEARRGFVAQRIGFDAALVSLDLADFYAGHGRSQEMLRLAEEMLPIFQVGDLHREAIAALIVFQQAVRMERVSSGLLQEIGSYLRQARTDPKLHFEEPKDLRS
ncbi:MAG TPA: tetratricopeptide repeat protein [Thermoanaerobaculia bacterium]|nr:tetratricopeptide repeat protein [Thermoanaerobaculia bacterium]